MRRMNYIIGPDPLVFWGPLLPHIFWITNGPRRPLTSCSAFTSRSNFDLLVKKGKPPTVQKDCWSETLRFSENAQLVGPMCNMNQTAHKCGIGNPWKSPYHLRQQLRFLILNRNSGKISHLPPWLRSWPSIVFNKDWASCAFSKTDAIICSPHGSSAWDWIGEEAERVIFFAGQSDTGIRVLTQALDLCLAQK